MRRKFSLFILGICLMITSCNEVNVQSGNPEDYGYAVTPASLTIHETGQASKFRVHLHALPAQDVVVSPTFSDNSEFSIVPDMATLNAENYAQGVEFTVTPINDNMADGLQTVPVSLTLFSADSGWAAVPVQTLQITCQDASSPAIPDNPNPDNPNPDNPNPDNPGPVTPADIRMLVAPAALELTESGNGGEITVTLSDIPGSNVTITPAFEDKTEFNISPTQATLNASNWQTGIVFKLTPKEDGIADGSQTVPVSFSPQSTDNILNNMTAQTASITVKDSGLTGIKIRFMAANTTSGTGQDYDDGKGIRMFQAMKPDIVLIQEFAYSAGLRKLVDTAFGPEFHYYPGSGGNIPNGVISRYPIIASGTWDSKASDRENEWAIIDIPGDRDLLAVSVHFLRASVNEEYRIIKDRITAKQKEGNYYVVLGGDFNAKNRTAPAQILGSLLQFKKDGSDSKDRCYGATTYPVDQNGNNCTSAERDDPYDWVVFDPDFDKFEVPVVIGNRSYPNGHVLDSRVYDEHNELSDIPPVQAEDSWKCSGSPNCEDKSTVNQFQHMPVIRDVMFVPGQ